VSSPTLRSEDRVPFPQMLLYGVGAFVNNLLAGAIGSMMIVLNLGLGMNPALVGSLAAIPRLFDAMTDPIMGYISDNTQSRWGRRRPYIFIGAILVGLVFIGMWQLPAGRTEDFYFTFFLIGSLLFYTGYTIFATPWVALGYELTNDYHERTRLMGTQNFIGQLAYFIPPWLLTIMQSQTYFANMVDGAKGVAIVIGLIVIVLGVLPAIFLREKLLPPAQGSETGVRFDLMEHIKGFFRDFATSLKFLPFLQICLATFLVFNGFILIASFQTYVLIYYVSGGDQVEGAKLAGYAGTVGTISTFAVIAFVTWLGTKIGKQRAFLISTGISAVGYGLKWFCYNPEMPWLVMLPAPLLAFGLGGLFTIMPAMMADVVDQDELKTYKRREGMYGAIFWWVVKLGMAAALAGSGFLLNATGFDVALGGNQSPKTIELLRLFDTLIPATASLIAMLVIAWSGLTEQKSAHVRDILEARRAEPAPAL
jgi:glycoside/pentoside/hexuronide:cation symporter, GPH family